MKPIVLSFEHCASLQHGPWRVHVLAQDSRENPQFAFEDTWERIITIGDERIDTPIYTQLDGNQVSKLIKFNARKSKFVVRARSDPKVVE